MDLVQKTEVAEHTRLDVEESAGMKMVTVRHPVHSKEEANALIAQYKEASGKFIYKRKVRTGEKRYGYLLYNPPRLLYTKYFALSVLWLLCKVFLVLGICAVGFMLALCLL